MNSRHETLPWIYVFIFTGCTIFCTQVKVGANGEIILDEESTTVETTAVKVLPVYFCSVTLAGPYMIAAFNI
jgi:hypothetical protein